MQQFLNLQDYIHLFKDQESFIKFVEMLKKAIQENDFVQLNANEINICTLVRPER